MSSATVTQSNNASVIPPELRDKGWRLRRDKESGNFRAENERLKLESGWCLLQGSAVAEAIELQRTHDAGTSDGAVKQEEDEQDTIPVMPFIAKIERIKTPADFQNFLDAHNLNNVPDIDEARDERFTPTGQETLKRALDECSRRLYADTNGSTGGTIIEEPDVTLVARDPEQLSFTFDYTSLDSETRIVVQQCTRVIKDRLVTIRNSAVEIGERLNVVKDSLEHGRFGDWLKAEFQWSASTAEKMMRAARLLGENTRYRELEEQFGQTALYLLSAPSTPEAAREEAATRAESGEQITHSTARVIVARHKTEASAAVQATAHPWTSEKVVAAIQKRGPLTLLQLEDLGCPRYPIITAEQDGLIRRRESGAFELTNPPQVIEEADEVEEATSDSALAASAHTVEAATEEAPRAIETQPPDSLQPESSSTPAAPSRPATQERAHSEAARPAIEALLRGRQASVTFTFNMPGVKGLAQVSVMTDGKYQEASRDMLAVGEVRLPEPAMKLIREHFGAGKYRGKPASATAEKEAAAPKADRIVAAIKEAKTSAELSKLLTHYKLDNLARFSAHDANLIRTAVTTKKRKLKQESPASASKKTTKKSAAKKTASKSSAKSSKKRHARATK